MPKCGSVMNCGSKVSQFAYDKACLGDSKLIYCPRLSVRFMKTPAEWQFCLTEGP